MVWPRVSEMFMGIWLLISPFVFTGPITGLDWLTMIAGVVVGSVSLAACVERWQCLRLGTAAVALFLCVFGYVGARGHEAAPMYQNHILVGIILLLLVLLPSRADLPPPKWRDFGRQNQPS